MLKGTTKIELTDIHTGEKQTIEKHNMVTSVLSQLYQPVLGHLTNDNTLRGLVPAYAGLLGGLLLFDGTITENVNQHYAPAGVNLTGCARYNYVNTGTGKTMGSYNVTESVYDSANRKMTYVYDFNTSQGNGTIASVCLTNIDAGYGAYGSDKFNSCSLARTVHNSPYTAYSRGYDMTSGLPLGENYESIFYLDPANDTAYYIIAVDSTHLRIRKRRMGLKAYSLFSNEIKVMETIELPVLTTALGNYRCYNFDPADNALYIFSSPSSTIAINTNFHVTKIVFSTWAITQYTLSNTGDSILYGNSRFAFAHQGYCYLTGTGSPYSKYKIQISNTVNITKMSGDTGSYFCIPLLAKNGLIYCQYTSSSSNYMYIIDSTTNTVKKSANYLGYYSSSNSYYTPSYTPLKDCPMFYYATYGSSMNSFYYFCNYLATINNLTEPVVKTADKTMKVTYVIQEVTA